MFYFTVSKISVSISTTTGTTLILGKVYRYYHTNRLQRKKQKQKKSNVHCKDRL